MGTKTNQIATQYNAYYIERKNTLATYNPQKLVKYSELANFNCTLINSPSHTYSSNQLVKYSDIKSKYTPPTVTYVYYSLGGSTVGWTCQIKQNNAWSTLQSVSSSTTSGRKRVSPNITTSIQNAKYGSGRYVYPSFITIIYSLSPTASKTSSGSTIIGRDVIPASQTSGTYASVFDNSIKTPNNSLITEGMTTSTSVVIYAYVWPGEVRS